jgi:hypothetical protein
MHTPARNSRRVGAPPRDRGQLPGADVLRCGAGAAVVLAGVALIGFAAPGSAEPTPCPDGTSIIPCGSPADPTTVVDLAPRLTLVAPTQPPPPDDPTLVVPGPCREGSAIVECRPSDDPTTVVDVPTLPPLTLPPVTPPMFVPPPPPPFEPPTFVPPPPPFEPPTFVPPPTFKPPTFVPPPPTLAPPPPPTFVPPPPAAPVPAALELSDSTIGPGGDVTATGQGCVPDAPVSLSIREVPVGRAVADPRGDFEAALSTGSVDIGRHQVTAQCGRTLTAPLDVVLVSHVGTGTATVTIILIFLLTGVWFYGHRLASHLSARTNH